MEGLTAEDIIRANGIRKQYGITLEQAVRVHIFNKKIKELNTILKKLRSEKREYMKDFKLKYYKKKNKIES